MFHTRRFYAETPHGQVHVYDAGRPAPGAPALLLSHQSPQSGAMFEAALPFLTPHVRVLAMDTLGYGMSDRPSRPLEPEEYAQSMLAAMEAAGEDEFAVCGVHTGAVFGIEAAILAPQRVTQLVLSGPPIHPPRPPGTPQRQPKMQPPPLPREDGTHLSDLFAARRQVARHVSLETYQKRFLTAFSTGPSATSAYHAVYKYDLTERLKLVKCPLLIVYGDQDVETPNIERSLPWLEGIPRTVIPGGDIYTVDVCAQAWSEAVLSVFSFGPAAASAATRS
jgi:pimeloyl-ACP methyl ester carboxylesterase